MAERKFGHTGVISVCATGAVTPLPAFPGRVIATFSCSGEKEVNLAVEDAKAAFNIWRQKSGLERGRILLEAARIIRVCFLSPLPGELAVLAPRELRVVCGGLGTLSGCD